MQLKVLALGGDGIGPEVVNAGLKVLECAAESIDLVLDINKNPENKENPESQEDK